MEVSIGVASELSGVGIETIRYYEREGITPEPNRTAAGRRVYDPEAISRLRFIKRCRDLGFSILDIKVLLELANSNAASCDEANRIASNNLTLVRSKIDDLNRMENALRELVVSCQKGRKECPMLQRLFAD